tara:strand:- start:1559 stop:1966 length:408 start_codon:yes stop_codon:yes gene_type:complete
MISSHGNTFKSDNLIVTQTIGQQSIVGNYDVANFHYNQGFQQTFWYRLIQSNQPDFLADYFPNPFTEKITFRFTNLNNEPFEINIFDTSGRLVFNAKQNLNEDLLVLDLTKLPSGSYLVSFYNTKKIFYTKIIRK